MCIAWVHVHACASRAPSQRLIHTFFSDSALENILETHAHAHKQVEEVREGHVHAHAHAHSHTYIHTHTHASVDAVLQAQPERMMGFDPHQSSICVDMLSCITNNSTCSATQYMQTYTPTFINIQLQKPYKRAIARWSIDCSQPVQDKVLDIDEFFRFFQENLKVTYLLPSFSSLKVHKLFMHYYLFHFLSKVGELIRKLCSVILYLVLLLFVSSVFFPLLMRACGTFLHRTGGNLQT